MKIIFIIFFIFFSNYIFANEEENNEIEVINLHESKSLDQMVMENLNNKNKIEEEVDILDKNNEKETTNIEIEENETTEVELNQIKIVEDNFIHKNNISDLKTYFTNLQNTNSKTLQKEIVQVLENFQIDIENDKDK